MFDRMKLSLNHSSRMIWLLFTVIVVALIFAGSAMTQSTKPQTKKSVSAKPQAKKATGLNPKKVKISCQAAITVDVKHVNIKKDSEEVVWESTGNKCDGWKVIFNKPEGSPFAPAAQFDATNNHSGNATVQPNPFGYRYTITVPGLPDLDPDVIIKGG